MDGPTGVNNFKIQVTRTGNEMPFTLISKDEIDVGNVIGIPRGYRPNGTHDNQGYDFAYILKYVVIAVIGVVAIIKTMNTENKLLKWGVRIISVGGIALSSMALFMEYVRMEAKFSLSFGMSVIRENNKRRVEDVINLIETTTGEPMDVDLINDILRINVAKIQETYDSSVIFKDKDRNRCTFDVEEDGNCAIGYTSVTHKDKDGKTDCCDLNPPEGVDPAIFWRDMGLMLLKEIAIGIAFEMIAKRVMARVTVLGSRVASKLIAVLAKKFASKALAKLAVKAAALSVKACMGPAGWVLGIFDAISMVSDILDFNGYSNFLENTQSQLMRNVTLRSEQTNIVSNSLDYPQCFPLRLAFETEFDAAMMSVHTKFGEMAFSNVIGDIGDKDWITSEKTEWGNALATVIESAMLSVYSNVPSVAEPGSTAAEKELDTYLATFDICNIAMLAGVDDFCNKLNEAMENELLRIESTEFETRDRILYENIQKYITREDIEKIDYFPHMSASKRIGVTLSQKGAEWWNESNREEWLLYHDTMNQSPPSLPPGYVPAPVAMYTKKFYRINMEDPGKSDDPNMIEDELAKPATLGFGLQSVVSLCEKPKNVNILGGENLFSDGIDPYELGVRFDYETGMCEYTKKYCDRMGLDFKSTMSRGEQITDCELTKTQEVFETIFGTTMTRNAKREVQEFEHKWRTGDAGEKTLAVLEYVSDPLGIGDMTMDYAEKLWNERREAFESGDPSEIAFATFQTISDPLGIRGKIVDSITSIPQVENALKEADNWTNNNVVTPIKEGICTAATEVCKFNCDAEDVLCQAPCITALGTTQAGCSIALNTCYGACNIVQEARRLACTVTHGVCTGFDQVVPLAETCKGVENLCDGVCDNTYNACMVPFVTAYETGNAGCESVRGIGIASCTLAQACYAGCETIAVCEAGCETIAVCDAACEVPAGSCVAGCATFAGLQVWNNYDDVYNRCKSDCFRDLGIDTCKSNCSGARQDCENECSTGRRNCENGCNQGYNDCASGFDNAYDSCKTDTRKVYDDNEPICSNAQSGCKEALCGADFDSCTFDCDAKRDQCNADVNSMADGCKNPCNSTRKGCRDVAKTIQEGCIGTCEGTKQSCHDTCNTVGSSCRG